MDITWAVILLIVAAVAITGALRHQPDLDAPIDMWPTRLADRCADRDPITDAELDRWRDYARRYLADSAHCQCRTCRALGDPALSDALWRAAVRDLRSTR